MPTMTAEDYPPTMGYYDYTPLHAPYEMSWPAKDCNTCGSPDLHWAYPLGEVEWPRQVDEVGTIETIRHSAQPWYACTRCWNRIRPGDWDGLAADLGLQPGAFARLAAARLSSSGYAWTKHRTPRP
ncbi:hypothetical protein [Streptomyces sp. NPDC059783]|uniref:hypothetical protein n=1 Tax=Streptomyces sp. NPDC059783 TaxID=3346944 RepID=UPI0036637023